ncbi:hypothetical protein LC612_29520 [Nostoc sp. CHAB 5834]|nr:hypothetical protein [Nostoc sp. CHAB 5834]
MSNVYLLKRSRSVIGPDGREISRPSLTAVAVQFLSRGRNAWHSTWVRSYEVGDFFRDGSDVQTVIAKRKTPGTVFYLKVLPAFLFNFGDRKFVVTEINTMEPFRHIDLDAARYGLMAFDLDSFIRTIEPSSNLWKPNQPKRNHIIAQEVSEDYIDLATYTALSKGRDKHTNPPIGSYRRVITGTFLGESDWYWGEAYLEYGPQSVSLRWFNKALEAFAESRERIGR